MGTTAQKLQRVLDTKNAISSAIIDKGGTLAANAPFSGYAGAITELPSGGGETNISGGTIDCGMTVNQSGGTISGTMLMSGTLNQSGGSATGVTIGTGNGDACMNIFSGGSANGCATGSGGYMKVSSGGKLNGCVMEGGTMEIFNGGEVTSMSTTNNDMWQIEVYVRSGGLLKNSIDSAVTNITYYVNSGGTISGGTICPMGGDIYGNIVSTSITGNMTGCTIQSGASAVAIDTDCGIYINGGTVSGFSNAGDSIISGGTTYNITNFGRIDIYGGEMNNVSNNGSMITYSSSMISGMSIYGYFIMSGPGGTFNDMTIESGGDANMIMGGELNGCVISNGGSATIRETTMITSMTVKSGGTLSISSDNSDLGNITSETGATITYT